MLSDHDSSQMVIRSRALLLVQIGELFTPRVQLRTPVTSSSSDFSPSGLTMEAYATTTTIVLLDVPPQTSLTLDTLSFSSTASFRGIKFIGPGIHLLTYGLDKSELSMRNGLFFLGSPGTVSAWQWNKE